VTFISFLLVTKFTMSFLVTGPPASVHDWTNEAEIGLSNQNDPDQFNSKKNWRLLRCQNGKSVFLSLVLSILVVEVGALLFFHWQDCASLKSSWKLNTLYAELHFAIVFVWITSEIVKLTMTCCFDPIYSFKARSCSRAMRAVGVVEATCEAIFGLVMSMDVTRYE
jgi:hypothetical protein